MGLEKKLEKKEEDWLALCPFCRKEDKYVALRCPESEADQGYGICAEHGKILLSDWF